MAASLRLWLPRGVPGTLCVPTVRPRTSVRTVTAPSFPSVRPLPSTFFGVPPTFVRTPPLLFCSGALEKSGIRVAKPLSWVPVLPRRLSGPSMAVPRLLPSTLPPTSSAPPFRLFCAAAVEDSTPPSEVPMEQWSVEDVERWVREELGFSEEAKLLKINNVDGVVLAEVTDVKLERWGVLGGPATKIIIARDRLQGKDVPELLLNDVHSWYPDADAQQFVNQLIALAPVQPEDLDDPKQLLGLSGLLFGDTKSTDVEQMKKDVENAINAGVELYPFTVSPLFHDPGESGSPVMTLRSLAKAVWNQVLVDGRRSNLILGSPGIGKSRSMVYLLRRVLMEKAPEVVVWQSDTTKKAFSLVKDDNDGYKAFLCESDFKANLCKPLRSATNFLFTDLASTRVVDSPGAIHIVNSSPDPANYAEWRKQHQARVFYLSPWSLEELQAVRPFMRHYAAEGPSMSAQQVEALFKEFGGVPRVVFGSLFERTNQREKRDSALDMELTKKWLFRRVAGDPMAVGTPKVMSAVFHLYGVDSDPDKSAEEKKGEAFANAQIDEASQMVNELLLAKHFAHLNATIELAEIEERVFVGHKLWEDGMRLALSRGVSLCDESGEEVLPAEKPPEVVSFQDSYFEAVATNKSRNLLLPLSTRQPLIDASVEPGRGFNFTIAKKHTFSQTAAKDFEEVLRRHGVEQFTVSYIVPWRSLKTFKAPKPKSSFFKTSVLATRLGIEKM